MSKEKTQAEQDDQHDPTESILISIESNWIQLGFPF
jgi:hypothetical protein